MLQVTAIEQGRGGDRMDPKLIIMCGPKAEKGRSQIFCRLAPCQWSFCCWRSAQLKVETVPAALPLLALAPAVPIPVDEIGWFWALDPNCPWRDSLACFWLWPTKTLSDNLWTLFRSQCRTGIITTGKFAGGHPFIRIRELNSASGGCPVSTGPWLREETQAHLVSGAYGG